MDDIVICMDPLITNSSGHFDNVHRARLSKSLWTMAFSQLAAVIIAVEELGELLAWKEPNDESQEKLCDDLADFFLARPIPHAAPSTAEVAREMDLWFSGYMQSSVDKNASLMLDRYASLVCR